MKMISQSAYEEQFTNNDITAAKKLLTEMKSVHRVAEAVDSIIIPDIKEESELEKIQVVILNGWDEDEKKNISLSEGYVVNGDTVAKWNDSEKSYYQVCNDTFNFSSTKEELQGEEDLESGNNLSWLLNFKVESLFNPLDRKCDCGCEDDHPTVAHSRVGSGLSSSGHGLMYAVHSSVERMARHEQSPPAPARAVALATAYGGPPSNASSLKKPPFTYTELIEQALREKGELTVSGIYKWISQNFQYYRADDDRWKNSVRHNLSINPHFSKGSKARKGAGHLWTVVTGEDRSRSSWKRRRLEQFVSEQRRRDAVAQHQETSDAARHIAGDACGSSSSFPGQDYEDHDHRENALAPRQQGWITTQVISMEQTAEDILMGVKREVEVEYLAAIPVDDEAERSCGSADSDFLNPVSKHEAVKESGLLSDEGLVPLHYGDIHLSHPSTDVSFFSDEEMTLQYYELALAAVNQ